ACLTRLPSAGPAVSYNEHADVRPMLYLGSARGVKIRIGYQISYECPNPTPMLLVLSVHPSRHADLLTSHRIVFDPPIAAADYRDGFGNICTRILAPTGTLTISSDQIVADPGTPD